MPKKKTKRTLDPRVEALCSTLETMVVTTGFMGNSGLVVYQDSACVMENDAEPSDDSDFVRTQFPPDLHALFTLAAIKCGGDKDLVKIMGIVRGANPTQKNSDRLQKAVTRLRSVAYSFAEQWQEGEANRHPRPTRH